MEASEANTSNSIQKGNDWAILRPLYLFSQYIKYIKINVYKDILLMYIWITGDGYWEGMWRVLKWLKKQKVETSPKMNKEVKSQQESSPDAPLRRDGTSPVHKQKKNSWYSPCRYFQKIGIFRERTSENLATRDTYLQDCTGRKLFKFEVKLLAVFDGSNPHFIKRKKITV